MGAQTGDGEVAVGDVVNVPGDMHGTVRFIGSVKGKAGIFAGVELSKEFAHRGKNDGDVDGLQYFTTSVPHSGIFLPVSRATKRHSATGASTPTTPLATTTGSARPNSDGSGTILTPATVVYTPPTTAVSKLSQSVGPGRAASPLFRPKARPSLPRPESPLRRQQNAGTTSGRPSLGASIASGRPGGAGASSRYAPSPIPGKVPAGASAAAAAAGTLRPKRNSNTFSGDPVRTRFPTTASGRPAAKTGPGGGVRSESALGDRGTHDSGWAAGTSAGPPLTRSSNGSYTSSSGYGTKATSAYSDDDVVSLRQKLEERDQRLKEQAASLAEMEQSLTELQSLITTTRSEQQSASGGGGGDAAADDVAQLRALLREKNEKITMLTAEFDAHRADFRSTIDTLELASTETERVYEKRVEELLQDIRELQDRSEDVEIVARQLKQLEELVQELEEGLEDARRGEAEARSEVEFLRGEVERGRSELKREREKAAAALKAAGAAGVNGTAPSAAAAAAAAALDGYKEVEQRDDEIRGLKAIIHSLSRDSVPDTTMPHFDGNGVGGGGGGGRPLAGRNGSIVSASSATATAAVVSAESHRRLSQQVVEEKAVRDRLEHEIRELRGLVERKLHREGELEREIERLRRGRSRAGERKSGSSEHTITMLPKRVSEDAGGAMDGGGVVAFDRRRDALLPSPASGAGIGAAAAGAGSTGGRLGLSQPQLETMHESDTTYSSDADGSALWCEICETGGHDILTCTNVFGHQKSSALEPSDTSALATPVVMNNGFVTTPAGAGASAAAAAAAAMSPATITTTTAPATPTVNAGAFADAAPSPLGGGQQLLQQRTGRDVVVQGLKGLAIASLPHQQHHYQGQGHHHYRQGGDDSGTADLSSVSGSVSPAPPPPAHPPPPPADFKRTAAAAERADSAASPQPSTASSSSSSPPLSQGQQQPQQQQAQQQQQPRPTMPDPADSGLVPGKATGVVDPNKWCALCERDGHESVDCPFEEGL